MFGVGLSLSSLVGLALGVVSVMLVLSRIGPEERMLLNEFGDKYRDFSEKSHRLVPFVY